MGVTVQWRGEPEREPHTYGKTVTFGNIRDKGSGYMSYSERIGPGVVILAEQLDPTTKGFADALMHEGFTVLVPELTGIEAGRAQRVAVAAIDYLVDNWHPRIGVVAFGTAAAMAEEIGERHPLDATALYEMAAEIDISALAVHFAYDLS